MSRHPVIGPCETAVLSMASDRSGPRRAGDGSEGVGGDRRQELTEHGLHGWTFGLSNTKRRLGVCKYQEEADRGRRVLRPEQPRGVGPRHAPARDRPRHRRPRRQARPEVEGRRRPAGGHAPVLRDLAPGGGEARRLAGDVPGLREDRPSLQAAEEPGRLPLQVRGPLAADVRVHGRPGTQARRADDRPGVGELGGDVCGLRDGASADPQAEGGRLAVQVPPPLRDRLAAPVLTRRLFLERT